MIDMAQLSARVEQKCSRHTHDTPAAGKLWLFGRIHFDNVQVISKHLAQPLDCGALNRLAGNASRSGEIDQDQRSGVNRSKIGKQILGAELEHPVIKQINAKAAQNDRQGESGPGEDICIKHLLHTCFRLHARDNPYRRGLRKPRNVEAT